MRALRILSCIALLAAVGYISSCTHKPYQPTPGDGDFPPDVARIIVNKCAISGCHNAASYLNAHELLLDSWQHLMGGSVSGAVVVPFSPRFSALMYFVNTDPARGPQAFPTMPESTTAMPQSPLSASEYTTLYNWIAAGAPDKNGNIPFSSNSTTRQKIYIAQQGCDLVAVVDAATNLVMRYIPIGSNSSLTESPHSIRTSSDGNYAYVSFLAGNFIQKIDTRTDTVVASMNLGPGSWNTVYLAPADTELVAPDWTANGRIVFGNTASMQTIPSLTGSGAGLFVYPHGITSTAAFDTCIITAQYGNVVYRYAPRIPYYRKLSINGRPAVATNNADSTSPNPHDIIMAPDYSKYFLTCQGTNEVRVLDAHTNAVLDSIHVGLFPQEFAISQTKPYLFVTCTEDNANTRPGCRGSVYVINYNTHEIVNTLYGDFYQPHAITVDDRNGKVYVVSSNANPNGPAPHHATACDGRPGWYTVYDLNTLQPLSNRRYGLTVMPYSAATRFKQ